MSLSKDHEEFEWINPTDFSKYNLIDNVNSAFEELVKVSSIETRA